MKELNTSIHVYEFLFEYSYAETTRVEVTLRDPPRTVTSVLALDSTKEYHLLAP